jgi:SAM-dependent methyltransferase
MYEKYKKDIVQLYEDRFVELGYDVKTVGWKSREDQWLRFKVLCEIGNLNNSSICDIGCGFGDLLDYLETKYYNFSYKGIDISPSLVEKAKELHPKYEFCCLDFLDARFNDNYDYFLLSGAVSYKMDNNIEYASTMISKMFSLCRKGIAINFLSSYVNFQNPINYHYKPEDILSFGKQLSRFVTLRHDYPLWEFTLYIFK